MQKKTVADGEVILRSGEVAEAAWRVVSGTVAVHAPGPDGRLQETAAHAGDVIGAVAVLDGARYDQTAMAQGAAVVEMLPRAELVRLLAASPDEAGRMLGTLFSAAEAAAGTAAPAPRPSASPAGARLFGLGEPLATVLGPEGIAVDASPYLVGRKETEDDDGLGRGVHLALADNRPFHLSRRHFAIERQAQGWIVRDCGSYHGTFVNGLLVGASEPHRMAKLNPGENEIIAGALNSPFRFRLAVAG